MRAQTGRKLALVDAMILLAVPAVWLATERHLYPQRISISFREFDDFYLLPMLHDQIGLFLSILSFALILIGFRSPRPGRRRFWRRPGLVACGAAAFGVGIKALSTAVSNYATVRASNRFVVEVFLGPWPYCGPAVAGAWLALFLTSLWRAERSWIDRLGRLVGVCWLLEYLLGETQGIRWLAIVGHLFSQAPS